MSARACSACFRSVIADTMPIIREYWKFGDFVSWDCENGDAGLLYQLFFEVNCAVQTAADESRRTSIWASLLGLAMLGATSIPISEQFPDFRATWREKVWKLLE